MDQVVESHMDWVTSSVVNDTETDFASTFCLSEKVSKLEINRFCKKRLEVEQGQLELKVLPEQVLTIEDLEYYSQLKDSCQLFYIGQRNSYARLYITRSLFEGLVQKYGIFDRIWDFVLPFNFKTRESDIGHAPFRFKQCEPLIIKQTQRLGSYECAYGFRYVELNHREGSADNPDYDPWSVRQTAVYQQYDSTLDKIIFVLISPSKSAKRALEQVISQGVEEGKQINPFDLHQCIISTLHENWRLYIRSLDRLLMNQSERVTLAKVQSETARLSPLTDFAVNFVDRQRLKKMEDKILDLIIIFESLYNTLSKLQRQCRLHCISARCKDCMCSSTIEEFEEQMYEVQVNLKKAEVLHRRAQGTAHLIQLSDLLDYENAQIAQLNEKSLNGLVKESKDENSKMRLLTEQSSRDAAAVKILTVITIIYLPMTVVLNFFSTQLVHVDDRGQISIISEAWWFAVAAVPMTVATFGVWKLWLSYTMRSQEHPLKPVDSSSGPLLSPDLGAKATHNRVLWPHFPSQCHHRNLDYRRRSPAAFDIESRPTGASNSLNAGVGHEKRADIHLADRLS